MFKMQQRTCWGEAHFQKDTLLVWPHLIVFSVNSYLAAFVFAENGRTHEGIAKKRSSSSTILWRSSTSTSGQLFGRIPVNRSALLNLMTGWPTPWCSIFPKRSTQAGISECLLSKDWAWVVMKSMCTWPTIPKTILLQHLNCWGESRFLSNPMDILWFYDSFLLYFSPGIGGTKWKMAKKHIICSGTLWERPGWLHCESISSSFFEIDESNHLEFVLSVFVKQVDLITENNRPMHSLSEGKQPISFMLCDYFQECSVVFLHRTYEREIISGLENWSNLVFLERSIMRQSCFYFPQIWIVDLK